jgi:hypothetical protein
MYYRRTPRTPTILFGRDRSGHRFSKTRKYTQTAHLLYIQIIALSTVERVVVEVLD